jgi:HEAT repeat protein
LFGALRDHERLSLLIKDEDPEVRKGAITALADLRLPASVNHLVMALVDEDPDVRIVAASALGEIGGADVLEPLGLALGDDDPWVRCAAIRGIARGGDPRSQQVITTMLTDPAGLVVIAALEALVEMGLADTTPLQAALDHGDEEVVKTAIQLLSRLGGDWLEGCRDRLLAHPHWDVRRSAIEALVIVYGEKAVPFLIAALEREQDELVRGQLKELVDRLQ